MSTIICLPFNSQIIAVISTRSIVSSTGRSQESPPHLPKLVLLPFFSSVSPFPVAVKVSHVSAGPRCSAFSFNKSSYVFEARWRLQTTISARTLHQRVIWLSQAQ